MSSPFRCFNLWIADVNMRTKAHLVTEQQQLRSLYCLGPPPAKGFALNGISADSRIRDSERHCGNLRYRISVLFVRSSTDVTKFRLLTKEQYTRGMISAGKLLNRQNIYGRFDGEHFRTAAPDLP